MPDYYAIPAHEFGQHSSIEFRFVDTHDDLCRAFARELVDLIKSRAARGEMARVILPVGPIEYRPFAELCNAEGVSCASLVVFAMDEYCLADGTPIPPSHPLSFRAFFQRDLLDRLDPDKQLPPDQLIMPDPARAGEIRRMIDELGGIDVTYGGMGINGHFAFNTPSDSPAEIEALRNTSVRLVSLGEGDAVQMAMGGTGGNLEVIPPRACTLGMRELLGARELHLTFMRSWHAGVLRRALFGPVSAAFPGSLVQLHPHVTATVTAEAAALPPVSLLQLGGHAASEGGEG